MLEAVEHGPEVLLLLQVPRDRFGPTLGLADVLFRAKRVQEMVSVTKVVLASLAGLLEPLARVLAHGLEQQT